MSSAVAAAPAVEYNIDRQARPSRLRSAPLFVILGLLLFGPIAFGAVEPWAIFTLEVGTALLFGFWALEQARYGELRLVGNPAFPPMLAFGVLIIFQLASRQTAYRAATISGALLYCTYGLLGFLVVQYLRSRWQVRIAAITFAVYGSALAIFALLQSLASNGKLYWVRTPRFGGWIFGPYVNHNHYAGLMEMLTPIPLVIFFSRRVPRQQRTIAALAAIFMGSTIFLSGSRGGMLAFAVQMAVLGAVVLRRHKNGRTALALAAVLTTAFALLAWLGGGALTDRMGSIPSETRTELSGGMRVSIDRDCLKMFAQKPVLGWGLGSFPDVYPQFRSFYTNVLVDKAHNDYLQLLVEMGGLGFLVLIWFLTSILRAAIHKLQAWHTDTNTDLTLAALLGVTGILVHSFVDFNLQIPANASLFCVLCAVAAMEPRFASHRSKHSRKLDQIVLA